MRHRLLERLAPYTPTLIGTPPLGIDVEGSDIDIACSATLDEFAGYLRTEFSSEAQFGLRRLTSREQQAVCADWYLDGWRIEVFAQACPLAEQWGVRHFVVERRLLDLRPTLKPLVVVRKQQGLNTEAAFADVLGLEGDPFVAVAALERLDDESLEKLIASALVVQP